MLWFVANTKKKKNKCTSRGVGWYTFVCSCSVGPNILSWIKDMCPFNNGIYILCTQAREQVSHCYKLIMFWDNLSYIYKGNNNKLIQKKQIQMMLLKIQTSIHYSNEKNIVHTIILLINNMQN